MVDQDCEQRGIVGGVCSDAICYAPPVQCTVDGDCLARGPEYSGGRCVASQCRPSPRWRCDPLPAVAPTDTKRLTIPVVDASSLMPLPGVRIVACQKLDLSCAKPVAEEQSGGDGHVVLTLPANFSGYLQQTELADYLPALYFLPNVIPANSTLSHFTLLSKSAADKLARDLGVTLDSQRGHLMLTAADCFAAALAGVSFTSPQQDQSAVPFYVRGGTPALSSKETDGLGQGGYLNFPASTALLSLKQVKTGLELTTVSVLVRAGFVTVAFIPPQFR